MVAHNFSDTAAVTSLVSGIDNSVDQMTVASTSGFPDFPFWLVIDRLTPSLEVVEVTGGTGGLLDVTRGVSGTAGVSHNANAIVEHLAPAEFLTTLSGALEILTGLGPSVGVFVQDSPGTFAKRTLTAASDKVVITNGTGAAGNPTFDVDESEFTGIPKAAVTGAPAGSFVGSTDTQTLTNKRVTPRVTTISSSATPTINTDNCDFVTITALAEAVTSMTSGLSGTPTNGQKLLIRFKDNGSARAITWGSGWESTYGTALPSTTVAGKRMTVGAVYDAVTSKWSVVGVAQEA